MTPATTGTDLAKTQEPQEEQDYNKLYEQFMQEELAKLPKPKTGKIYTVPTTVIDPVTREAAPTYRGMLMVVGNDRIILKTDDKGDVTITPDMLDQKCLMQLFPKQYARSVVVARLDKVLNVELASGKKVAVAAVPHYQRAEIAAQDDRAV